jgi:hypothetical protein
MRLAALNTTNANVWTDLMKVRDRSIMWSGNAGG